MALKATRATLLFHEKVVRADGAIIELIIWRLPRATADRRHGLKYRLYYGRGGKCLVRYDNEAGKGDHRHVKGRVASNSGWPNGSGTIRSKPRTEGWPRRLCWPKRPLTASTSALISS